MPQLTLAEPVRPTLHFVGVSTAGSSIMRVFPEWAGHLGLDAAIAGIDLPPKAPAEDYRAVVGFLREAPMARGALVTTHKIDLFRACRDLFDEIDPMADFMGETSCLSKPGGRLRCNAKDPLTSRLALEALLPAGQFARTGGAAFVMGAGGAATAITWNLLRGTPEAPAEVIVSDRDPARLQMLAAVHERIESPVPVRYVEATGPDAHDAVLERLPPGSLVVNATGLGKDASGSPLGAAARFPQDAIAWDLNYRGDLRFLDQARAQADARGLRAEDGWVYFLHGWTQVIAEVFGIEVPTHGPGFAAISAIARNAGRIRHG